MIRTLSVLAVCTVLLGCATHPSQEATVQELTLQELKSFIGKSSDTVAASFGAPSRQHPGKHAVYWEYRKGERLVVFLIRNKGTVADVNAGTDEMKVYDRWASSPLKMDSE
jgi:hypothetical protein